MSRTLETTRFSRHALPHAGRLRHRRDLAFGPAALAVGAVLVALWVDDALAAERAPRSLVVEETPTLEVVLTVEAAQAPTFQVFRVPGQPQFVVELPGLQLQGALETRGAGVLLLDARAEEASRSGPPRLLLSFADEVDYDAQAKGATLEVRFTHHGDKTALLAGAQARREKARLAAASAEQAARVAEEQRVAALEAKKRSDEERALALQQERDRQRQEEEKRQAALDARKKADEERALAAEKKRQEEDAKRLAALEAKKKADEERAAAAEKKRLEDEHKRLAALEAKKQADLERAAAAERKRLEEEAKRQVALEAKKKSEEERAAALQQEREKKRQEEEQKRLAALEKKRQEEEAKRLAALEAERKAAEEKAQAERARKEAEEARVRAEAEAKAQRERAVVEAKRQAEAEAARKSEEARRLAEEARAKDEAQKRQAAEAARQRAEQEQARQAAEVARRKAEEEARRQADEAARMQAEQVRLRATQEAERQAAEARRAEEERRRAGEERHRLEAARLPRAEVSTAGGTSSSGGPGFGGHSIELAPPVRYQRLQLANEDEFGGGDEELDEAEGRGVLSRVTVQRTPAGSRVGVRVDGGARYDLKRRGKSQLVLTLFDTRADSLDVRRVLDARALDTSVMRVLPSVEEDQRFRIELLIELREQAPVKIGQSDGVLWLDVGNG